MEKKKNDLESIRQESVPVKTQQSSQNFSSATTVKAETVQKTTVRPVTSFKDLNIKSAFSLSQVSAGVLKQNDAGEAQVVSNPNVQMNERVEEQKLAEAIKKYAEMKLAAGSRQMHTTLTARPPQLENETQVVLLIDNEVQREGFQQHKQDFLDYLRKELQNSFITLSLQESADVVVKKAYTPLERFETLKEKNPLLLELKKRLDLEIDY